MVTVAAGNLYVTGSRLPFVRRINSASVTAVTAPDPRALR
jgi:hypothetical protein